MNKNSTQKGIRNFVSKISNSITILPALPANLRVAGSFILIQYNELFQLQPVSNSKSYGSFSFKDHYNKFIVRMASVLKTADHYPVFISNNRKNLPGYLLPGSLKR